MPEYGNVFGTVAILLNNPSTALTQISQDYVQPGILQNKCLQNVLLVSSTVLIMVFLESCYSTSSPVRTGPGDPSLGWDAILVCNQTIRTQVLHPSPTLLKH